MDSNKPNYSNWVSKKLIFAPVILVLIFIGLSFFNAYFLILAGLFLFIATYFAYAWIQFSPSGKNVQTQIQEEVFDNLNWNGTGKVLDIGCGNAPLSIMAAKRYSDAKVIGIDYWGKTWDYSKAVCERNAEIAGVAGRVVFQKASASKLPFEDESFDLVISNLVFHEVKESEDKKELIREALRVVKKGGKFSLQDLFLIQQYYGNIDELLATIRGWGVNKVEFIKTCDRAYIPRLLKLPFMVGTIGIIRGEK